MSVVAIPEVVAIDIAGQCDRGKVRDENQSMVRHTSSRLGDLLVVAEGVGVNGGGTQAARMAVDTISSGVEGMPAFFPPDIAVEEAVCHANAAIVAAAAEPERADPQVDLRMGSKVVAALLRADSDPAHPSVHAIIGGVGDSRAYVLHNRSLTQFIPGSLSAENPPESADDAEEGTDKSALARYLGQELNVRVEMREVSLEAGDTLLLCTHGLWGYVAEREIERILVEKALSAEAACRALVTRALDAGGHENVAVEIAHLPRRDSPAANGVSEPQPVAQLEAESLRESAPAPDTLPSDWSVSPSTTEKAGSLELEPPRRKGVFGLIKGFGKRGPEKELIAERPASPEPATPASGDQTAVLSWVEPEPIAYGVPLSSLQLNARASVPGKFVYTPGPGYKLSAGTHTLWVTFLAAGAPEDNPVLASVSIAVSKAIPSIQWPTPSHIPPGVALGAGQLNASASVPGTFEYIPAAGETLSEGPKTLSVTFTPKEQANYTTARATISVIVAKVVPVIEWTIPGPIPCGRPLGADQLNASASVPGAFDYSPAAGSMLSAGSHILSVTFTPTDGASCAPAKSTVTLDVVRGTPQITWPAPERITYGEALNGAHLNAAASVPGDFVYNPGPGAVLAAGEHTPSVTFTPSNLSDYTPAHAAVSLTVDKAMPAVTWSAPEPIHSATPLGPVQLNAHASIPGTFAYSPAAGETLAPGVHSLAVVFTPADRLNYTQAQASTPLTVTELAPSVIAWPNPRPISYGTALGDEQFNASSSVAGSFHYAPSPGDVLPPGEHTLSVIFTPEDQERYAQGVASVVIIVEGSAHAASAPAAAPPMPVSPGAPAQPAPVTAAEQEIQRKDDPSTQNRQRETRMYKGAIYEKGDDGQWHLQRR